MAVRVVVLTAAAPSSASARIAIGHREATARKYALRASPSGLSASHERGQHIRAWGARTVLSSARLQVHASAAQQEVGKLASKGPKQPGTGYVVVITGSTKGVGRALAERFLQEGDSVVVTSRSHDAVQEAVEELGSKYGIDRVGGVACNVCKGSEVATLAEYTRQTFGRADIWINNAGTNAYYYGPLSEASEADLAAIVETNVLGVMLCCREAIKLMKEQPGTGHIFNMDGAGADGNPTPRFAAYGATKRGLQQFSKSLQAELKMQEIDNVVIHNLSPGMVTTELLMSGANTPQSKWFINCLAETAEDVADFLVPRVRQVHQSSGAGGSVQPTYIQFLKKPKAFSQIIGRALFGLRKNRWVPEE